MWNITAKYLLKQSLPLSRTALLAQPATRAFGITDKIIDTAKDVKEKVASAIPSQESRDKLKDTIGSALSGHKDKTLREQLTESGDPHFTREQLRCVQ